MTVASKVAWDDMVLPFQLDRSSIRGRVVRLDGALDTILSQHKYPGPVQALVAEAALLTALIGQTIKLRWRLSVQVRGEGAIRLIATDYFAPKEPGEAAEIRAYAGFDADALLADADPFSQIGKGLFAITIDQGRDMTPYQGITPLSGGSLAACAQMYFAQSEQLPTRFVLGSAEAQEPGEAMLWRAGGIMLQAMPEASPYAAEAGSGEGGLLTDMDILAGDEAEDWSRTTMLLETVELTELIGPHLSPDRLLLRLFHEETPRVFDAQPVRFGCSCSHDKVVGALKGYTESEINEMADENGLLTADCKFCSAHYSFQRDSL